MFPWKSILTGAKAVEFNLSENKKFTLFNVYIKCTYKILIISLLYACNFIRKLLTSKCLSEVVKTSSTNASGSRAAMCIRLLGYCKSDQKNQVQINVTLEIVGS